jgi:DNA gyrase subunit A
MVNLLPLEEGERIQAVLPIRHYAEDAYVFMATTNGTVKKTALKAFSNPRAAGIIAIDLRDGDRLVDVSLTNGSNEVMLFTNEGKAIRFSEGDVEAKGRKTIGVRGIRLEEGNAVNALIILGEGDILTATENGYGKRTRVDEFTPQSRGGQGVISIQTSERNGRAIGAVQVKTDSDIMLISDGGTLVRTPVSQISVVGRNTQGVTLIRMAEGEKLVQLAPIMSDENLPESTHVESTPAHDLDLGDSALEADVNTVNPVEDEA